jgi:hypothetical protein
MRGIYGHTALTLHLCGVLQLSDGNPRKVEVVIPKVLYKERE